jgi:ribosomal protein S18 acetylase RimI-like enzyme
VAEVEGSVVGFCFGLRQEESIEAAVIAFGAMPEWRRQGIGRELLNGVVEIW